MRIGPSPLFKFFFLDNDPPSCFALLFVGPPRLRAQTAAVDTSSPPFRYVLTVALFELRRLASGPPLPAASGPPPKIQRSSSLIPFSAMVFCFFWRIRDPPNASLPPARHEKPPLARANDSLPVLRGFAASRSFMLPAMIRGGPSFSGDCPPIYPRFAFHFLYSHSEHGPFPRRPHLR